MISYQYDDANRLTNVGSIEYTWDDAGNLLNDGVNTYDYDAANRLISVNNQSTVSSYQYNGLGDRLSQTVNSVTTNYTLDLNAGLTQVLNDGTNTYLYGLGRISQTGNTTEYFLGDALGSVRQLTDATGNITLAKAYDPYGTVSQSLGGGASIYAYTGEQQDVSGLTYLRARYYSSGDGRFLSRDTWGGDVYSPMSFNRWGYTEGNPINATDPTGMSPCVVDPYSDRWTGKGWTDADIRKRVDTAEKHVSYTSGDTYVAAGIAIQCAGSNLNTSSAYSGIGIAQITAMQALTEWGEPIYEWDWWNRCCVYEREDTWPYKYKIENGHRVPVIRGYGLRKPEDEVSLDPNNTKDAVELMKREIQLVLEACGSKCTSTDRYIAAALAQNGPGFSYIAMGQIGNLTPKIRKTYGIPDDAKIHKDWFTYFARDADDGNMVNTKTQLNRFALVVNELKSRQWSVPYVDPIIERLKNW